MSKSWITFFFKFIFLLSLKNISKPGHARLSLSTYPWCSRTDWWLNIYTARRVTASRRYNLVGGSRNLILDLVVSYFSHGINFNTHCRYHTRCGLNGGDIHLHCMKAGVTCMCKRDLAFILDANRYICSYVDEYKLASTVSRASSTASSDTCRES